MDIRELLKGLASYRVCTPVTSAEISGIAVDSTGDLKAHVFVAIRGKQRDGHDFIPEAIGKGAAAVVFSDQASGIRRLMRRAGGVTFISVSDTRSAAARLSAKFNGYPSRHLHVCGITGTNGKTTITYLIEHLVSKAGLSAGVIGTVNYRFCGTAIPSGNTTPGPVVVQSLIRRMREQGVGYLAMEVSSHALDQNRTEGVVFSSAIFTNLTQDHLDYHHSMESYFRAKVRLFCSLRPQAAAVINSDDPYGRRLCRMTGAEVVTYGLNAPADVRGEVVSKRVSGTFCRLRYGGRCYPLRLKLIGEHNVYNCLAVFAWAVKAGFKPAAICRALGSFNAVPGRLERVGTGSGPRLFVDYAHTEDALRNVLRSLRQVSGGRIIAVFGCGGDRDKGKRPLMGRAATELADFAVITNDNPRREKPGRIIKDILAGVKGRSNYRVIPDRLAAIAAAVKMAGSNDVILVAGKGHEDYQIIGNRKLHFDDREAAAACLRSMK